MDLAVVVPALGLSFGLGLWIARAVLVAVLGGAFGAPAAQGSLESTRPKPPVAAAK